MQVTDFKPIKSHVQERPCNTLIGVCDTDHCGPQDVRNDPKSSNRSRLPEGKKTQELPDSEVVPEVVVQVHSFGKALATAIGLSQTPFTKPRTTPWNESCKIILLTTQSDWQSDV